jgi:hypothetical protein
MADEDDDDLYDEEFDFVDEEDDDEEDSEEEVASADDSEISDDRDDDRADDRDDRDDRADEPEERGEAGAEPAAAEDEYGRTEPVANYLVHVYEDRKFKRTIDRPFTPEDAEAFATEFNRTAKNYSRVAVTSKNDAKPKKALD